MTHRQEALVLLTPHVPDEGLFASYDQRVTELQALLVRRIRSGMADHGWSQRDLAQGVGISEKHMSQLLAGRTEGSLSMWQTLLDAVGESPRWWG